MFAGVAAYADRDGRGQVLVNFGGGDAGEVADDLGVTFWLVVGEDVLLVGGAFDFGVFEELDGLFEVLGFDGVFFKFFLYFDIL